MSMKEFDEAVAKMKAGHEYTQRQWVAAANAQKVTAEALASMQESNAELIKVVTKMCSDIRQDMQALLRELAAQRKGPQVTAPKSRSTMLVMRDDDGKIMGATFQ